MKPIIVLNPKQMTVGDETGSKKTQNYVDGELVFANRTQEESIEIDGFMLGVFKAGSRTPTFEAPVIVAVDEMCIKGDTVYNTANHRIEILDGDMHIKYRKVLMMPSMFTRGQIEQLAKTDMQPGDKVRVAVCVPAMGNAHITVDSNDKGKFYADKKKLERNDGAQIDEHFKTMSQNEPENPEPFIQMMEKLFGGEKFDRGNFTEFLKKVGRVQTEENGESTTNSPLGSRHNVNTLIGRIRDIGIFMERASTPHFIQVSKEHSKTLVEAANELQKASDTVLKTREEWEELYLSKLKKEAVSADMWKALCKRQNDILFEMISKSDPHLAAQIRALSDMLKFR